MSAGAVMELICRDVFFSFTFQRNWNPGLAIVSGEILPSPRTQLDLCAS
jgi:hypothetical protein